MARSRGLLCARSINARIKNNTFSGSGLGFGVRLTGELPGGSTATDLVLVVTEMLRRFGVVGSFVEFAGDGLASLALADRATISNMSPEFGATATLFPIDDETLLTLLELASHATAGSRACGFDALR